MITMGGSISGNTRRVSYELRLDSRFIERERRDLKEKKDGKARAERNNNLAWMESEQAVTNQQVAHGGGLLSSGGIGVALRKKASGKIGIKKGSSFRSVISRVVVNQLSTSP